MKWFGAIVVIVFAAVTFSRQETLSDEEHVQLPPDARRGPGGILIWHSGFHGGK